VPRTDGGIVRRAAWNLIDQGLSSITNAGATIVVAATLPSALFGWFAVGFTVATLLLQLVRQLVCQPLLLTASALPPGQQNEEVRRAVGAAATLGIALGVVLAAVSAGLRGDVRAVLFAVAVALPGLFVQDCVRAVAFSRARPQEAAASDALWLLALAVLLIVLRVEHAHAPWLYAAAWAGSGGVAGLAALLGLSVLIRASWTPRVRHAMSWVWGHRDLSRYLFLEIAAAYGSVQIAILMVTAANGPSAAGAFRGAQTLLGPVNVLGMAGMTFLVPELVRRPGLSRHARLGAAATFAGTLAAINVLYGLVLLSLPSAVGHAILGETWLETRGVLLPFTIWAAALALCLGPLAVLQVIGRIRTAAACSVVLFPLVMIGTLIGQARDGFHGAAVGIMCAQIAVLLVWWPALAHATPRSLSSGPRQVEEQVLEG
jgi:O-antigen/teichoic acid export membrane protein